MRRLLGPLVLLGLVLSAPPAAGGPYRWIDPNGNVVYSDRPPQPYEIGPRIEPPPSSGAPAAGPPVRQAASELLELSGVKDQLRAVAVQARDHLHQSLGHLEPRDLQSVDAVTARTLDPERLVVSIVEEFGRVIDDSKTANVRSWYASPTGRRITELEVRAASADRRRQIAAFAAELRVKPPPPAREALLRRLDAAAGATELSVEVVVGIAQAITRAAELHRPPEQRLTPGQLEAQARQIRLATLESFRRANAVAMLQLYRDVPDGDLSRYIGFLETEAGAWYGSAVRRSIVHALAAAVAQTTMDLARVVPPRRWRGPGTVKKPPPSAERTL